MTTMTSDNDLTNFYETVEILARDAGKVIAEAINKEKKVSVKGIDWDLVTEYDRRVEETVITSLSAKFPSHKFIGEEDVAKEGKPPELTNDPTWIIDPIDGTTNFVHKFPHVCISIALVINKRVEIGIVYNPVIEQFFSAVRGRGAFLNGTRIRTSGVQDLSHALVGMEPWLAKDEKHTISVYSRAHFLIQRTHGIRSLGLAALSLCYVAMGAIEAYHIEGIDPWDVAAGQLIIEEAGGTVVDTTGGVLDLMNPKVIAACNREIAEQIVNLFKETDSITQKKISDFLPLINSNAQ
ncbi:inositol monophosphatase 1-like [Diprion similis]|uniref:inositol monophosphatase 1-like n=1 Tax=Diprion similis TaxID=362088 RepID=UPI001EF8C4BC|nr:inositol monophosphatase 1-like [Diprion similis]